MPYQQITLAALQASLEASWDSAPFWSATQATRYLNHSLRLWNLLTGMWKRRVLLSTTAGAHYLPLPSSITYGMVVVWGRTSQALQISALEDLDNGRPRWEEEGTGDGGDVPTTPQLWAPVGLTEIAIWPADATGGNPVLVDGVAQTPVLVNPGDFVDIGSQDANAIAKLALHIACFTRGMPAVKSTQAYLQEFVQAAADQNTRLRNSSYFRKYLGLDFQKGLAPMVDTVPGGAGAGQGGQAGGA